MLVVSVTSRLPAGQRAVRQRPNQLPFAEELANSVSDRHSVPAATRVQRRPCSIGLPEKGGNTALGLASDLYDKS